MTSKLRVAHVDTERSWRGGQNQVLLLMDGLRERGHTNFLVSRPGGILSERATAKNYPIKEIAPFGEWDFIAAHFFNRWLKRERIDIVHAHSGHGAALAAFGTLGTAIPVVVTRRVDFPLSRNIFSRWKYGRARFIIAISEGVKRVLIESGVPSERIELIPSGVDFSRYAAVQKVERSQMQVPPDAVVIGQVAALAPHKDQSTFLKTLRLLRQTNPNIHGVIVGDGGLRAPLEMLASQLGLQEVVHFLGFHENPLAFLAAFDVFCLSSKEEGLGTSLLDAMALRVPVVATNVGGIPDLIQDGRTGYLAPAHTPELLAEKVNQALRVRTDDPGVLDRAFDHAHRFDIRMTVQKTEQVYQRLVA